MVFVVQWCLALCNPMDCGIPGLFVPHHLLKFSQVHVHCISDTIPPSHPLMPSSTSRHPKVSKCMVTKGEGTDWKTGTDIYTLSLVQSLSCVRLFATSWTAACQAFLSITNSQSSPKLMSIKSVMPSNHLILCRPLLLLPPILLSIRVFHNVSGFCIRWPKYWSFSYSISPSNEHLGLISSRIDWFDLLAAQGTLKSLLQYNSSKASIL